MNQAFYTPWKVRNEIKRWFILPWIRATFALNGIEWGSGWRLYGVPVVQRHRGSEMQFGPRFQLRSALPSNPLGPNHPVFLTTWQSRAVLKIGSDFGMTGGTICAAESILIGNRVAVGANSTIIDTDFHPLDSLRRQEKPADAQTASIVIEDDVFIGMQCLILKGVRLGKGCVIGAGSVVTNDIPAGVIAAGNPARILKEVDP